MEVEVLQDRLAKALSVVSRVAASTKAGLPILSNVLLRAEGKQLTLTATNLELATVEYIAAKVEKEGLKIPTNVLKYISENIDDSVRDLEGIINSLMAYSVVYNSDINMALARKVMPRFVESPSRELTIDDVKQSVCEHFNLKINQIDSRERTRKIAYARQVAMYLADRLTDSSHIEIGRQIGNRNHATVLHALKQISDLMEAENYVHDDIEELMAKLKTNV
jgi:chromosomal replication initiator protein